MSCHGDGCDVNANQTRVKEVSPKQRLRVEVWLRDFLDQCVKEGRYDLAEKLFKEELKKV